MEIIFCVWMDAEQKNDTWTQDYDHSCIVSWESNSSISVSDMDPW